MKNFNFILLLLLVAIVSSSRKISVNENNESETSNLQVIDETCPDTQWQKTPLTYEDIPIGGNTVYINGTGIFKGDFNSDYHTFISKEDSNGLPTGVTFSSSIDPLNVEWEITPPTSGCESTHTIKLVLTDSCPDPEIKKRSTWTLHYTNYPPIKLMEFEAPNIITDEDFEFAFPSTLYSNEANEDIIITARLENGNTLPAWIDFDNDEHKFSGTAPSNSTEDLAVVVFLSDSCNDHADLVYHFTIDVVDPIIPPTLDVPIGKIKLDSMTEWEFWVPEGTFSGTDLQYSAKRSKQTDDTNTDPVIITDEDGDGDGELIVNCSKSEDNSDDESNDVLCKSKKWWHFDSELKKFTGTTPDKCKKKMQIVLTASNSEGSESDTLYITIKNPKVKSRDKLTPQTAYTNQEFVYELEKNAFVDKQDETITYSADVISFENVIASLPTWLEIDPSTGTFVGTPDYEQCSEIFNITVYANDDCPNNGASDDFTLEVVNNRPTTNYQSTNYQVTVAQEFEFSLGDNIFSDEFTDSLKMYVKVKNDDGNNEDKPEWLNFDRSTYTFSGTVPNTYCTQELNIYVYATDECHKRVNVNFLLQITRPDPLPKQDTPLPAQVFYQNHDFNFFFEESDLFTEPLSGKYRYRAFLQQEREEVLEADEAFAIPRLPGWITFSPKDLSFFGHYPGTVCEEVFYIVIMAIDECGNRGFNTFPLVIRDNPPTIYKPLQNQRIRGNKPWSYTFRPRTFLDPEQTDLKYKAFLHVPNTDFDDNILAIENSDDKKPQNDWQKLPRWIKFNPRKRTFKGLLPPNQCDGHLNLVVVAKDDCGSKTPAEFTLRVNNLKPYVNKEMRPKRYTKGSDINFLIPEDTFVDPEGGKLRYGIHSNRPLRWLNLDAETGRFTGYAAFNIGPSATVTFYAIDECGYKQQTELEFIFKMPVDGGGDNTDQDDDTDPDPEPSPEPSPEPTIIPQPDTESDLDIENY
ncbi:dystroglycan-related [Anaeramoeba flamelloides]|uniref:Dystroglycan-related n=1 Tax=Anaeramoeba flamelloides TaxID=1746091 RepID=A0AAV7ZWD7_9EUKA|nr:dystroglycan-related [Anaeramoeba flamelloides]|eukprot:Anaeramoba_flamelloidesa568440_1449.p1 GENE.a568440_1449~~a568440_1449.p1  ORF type:complete len:972 (+),score=191.26 a568440_1449:70-2985(+)